MAEIAANEPDGILNTIRIEDRTYQLYRRVCADCQTSHLEVYRWCGTSYSRYLFPTDYDVDDFEPFARNVDDALLMTAAKAIQEFHRELVQVNSPHGIQADHSFAFRLLEYGRQRLVTLQRLGMLDAIVREEAPLNDGEAAVRAAFELGMATAEHRIFAVYEDYFQAGVALQEWREEGLPKARAERLRQGVRTRSCIRKAAETLYAKDPMLFRNDSETARRIQSMQLPELQKGKNSQLGLDAITRHLRALRKPSTEQGKSS